jgi:hypothetical protein
MGPSSLWSVIAAQRALVHDAEQRGVAGPALYRTAFELVEAAVLADAQRVAADARTPPHEREAAAAFVTATESARARGVRVDDQLLALARGWECRACHGEVPKAAALTGVTGGRAAIKLALDCRACGARTPATDEGHTQFDRIFGPLVATTWNPESHGFLWDRR